MKTQIEPLVFSRAALKEMDRRAVEEFRIPILVLMENAGRAVAQAAMSHLKPGASVLVVAGPGNNGGDGLVAARHLHNAGYSVEILTLFDPRGGGGSGHSPLASQLAITAAVRIPIHGISDDHAEVRDWIVESQNGDVVIDALFGVGLAREVAGAARGVIHALNLSHRTIVAVDIPSGLDADTGQPQGIAIKATQTVSFCGYKTGFSSAVAKLFVGKVTVADIGVPIELLRDLAISAG